MHPYLHYQLARHPRLYSEIVGLRRAPNRDKIVFLKIVEDGDVVFDVGANRGHYTALFSHIVGRRGRVYAFEPVPPTFASLSDRIRLDCRFDNVMLINAAVAEAHNESEAAPIYMPGIDQGQASLRPHKAKSWQDATITGYECRVLTIDRFASGLDLPKLDFVKLDVEGCELPALRGGMETISRHLPLLYVEVDPRWTMGFGYRPGELVEYLQGLGYSSFYLVDRAISLLKDPVTELCAERLVDTVNILCGVAGRHHRRLLRLCH